MTNFEYWKEVRESAYNLIEQVTNDNDLTGDNYDRDAIEEIINDYALHEFVDGHQWVIYYFYNLDVVKHSDNVDYMINNFGAEYAGQILAESGLYSLHSTIAYWCIYADIQDNLSDQFDEYESAQDVQ